MVPRPLSDNHTPIDVEHLARATLGDRGLERDVLVLFRDQSMTLMARLAQDTTDAAALAHTFKGSARAIGAFEVARTAEALEMSLGDDGASRLAHERLQDAVMQANRWIAARLGQPDEPAASIDEQRAE